jgi:hypothetical protein
MALIRQARGSIREPITQEALGDLVGMDKFKISRIERGAQELSRTDALAIAAVDPLQRGAAWLMFGSEGQAGQGARNPGNPPAGAPSEIVTRTVDVRPAPHQPTGAKKKSAKRNRGRSALAS